MNKKFYQHKRFWLSLGALAAAGHYAIEGNYSEALRNVFIAVGFGG